METKTLLQETYIQKSRLFLLPLVGIKRDKRFMSNNTYISSSELISEIYPTGIDQKDQILIVTFPLEYEIREEDLNNRIKEKLKLTKETMSGWEKYKIEELMSNPYFLAYHEVEDEMIFTFDLSNWSSDWSCFLRGRYSLFGSDAKEKIRNYRWTSLTQVEQWKLYCYLHPYEEKCLKDFAEELGLSPKELAEVKELCNKPNLYLEDYKVNVKKNES